MKLNNIISSSLLLAGIAYANAISAAPISAEKDQPLPMQKVKSIGPSITGVQVEIQGKIYLLLLQPKDANNIPVSLMKNLNNLEHLAKKVVLSEIRNKRFPNGVDIGIKAYGTVTPVDLGSQNIGYLTASHVLQKLKTPNDICITNRVLGENIPKQGVPILEVPSTKLEGLKSYTQFPMYINGEYLMAQTPAVLRYAIMQNWISGRFERLVGGASGAPVIIENPNRKGDYGIVSIFPGGVISSDGTISIAQMPRNEVLIGLKNRAGEAARKGGEYTVCE